MSRTKRNRGKPPGYDWWSKRPGSGPGKGCKRNSHQMERAINKKEIHKEITELQK